MYEFLRKATSEINPTQLPTPSPTVGFASPRKGDLLKMRLVHRNGKNATWVKLRECLITRSMSQANEEAPVLKKDEV